MFLRQAANELAPEARFAVHLFTAPGMAKLLGITALPEYIQSEGVNGLLDKLRTRLRLDESRLPAPMRLPTWFSAQWQHDSEWSTWPFEISA